MFKVRFLPGRFGDCIWVEYGDASATHRVLIDGGTGGTRHEIRERLRALPADERRFERVIVTHIDRDHIEGMLRLLEEDQLDFEVGDFWFNGWAQLPDNPDDEPFGAIQGERLTARILHHELSWNEDFGSGAVSIPATGALPVISLDGGMELTLLGPSSDALAALVPDWERELRAANLDPGFGLAPNDEPVDDDDETFDASELPDIDALADSGFEDDDSAANGSSIAVLAEFDGKRALFAADTPASALLEALERLSPAERLALDLFKISHHGSKNTTSRSLIEKVDCARYVFSTNGSIYKHPHAEAVSRVIKAGGPDPELVFNYKVDRNSIWDLATLKATHGYRTRYPAAGEAGVEIEL
ncbi:MAG TPA: MBL fold metallo-hydrolase [Thermoanaerobaculia bacterium]|nr:MBL fold metallo-hydrolase [Thermoanaerobaculia bacterium]